MSVFENRVMRRIFGPKRDEVTGQWRKLHSEELHDLQIKLRRIRWVGHVTHMGDERKLYKVSV
jgi:PAS domain-containing protein